MKAVNLILVPAALFFLSACASEPGRTHRSTSKSTSHSTEAAAGAAESQRGFSKPNESGEKSAGTDTASLSPKEIGTLLTDAVRNEDAEAIREWLKRGEKEAGRLDAPYMAALKSILFEKESPLRKNDMRLLEGAGMNPDYRGERGWPLLSFAVSSGRIEVAEWLLEIGGDVNVRSDYGSTALHTLASPMEGPVEKQLEWLELLLRYGIELDTREGSGYTALAYAALNDRKHPLLEALVEYGADYTIGDNEGNAPRSHAAQHGAVKNAAFLAALDAPMYSYRFPAGNEAPACRAVLSGDIETIMTLSNKRFEEMVARTYLLVPATPLHLAAEQGEETVIRALCEKGVDWNTGDRYGRSPLQLAVMSGRGKAIELLLDHGADPNFGAEEGASPFIVACATDPPIALRMLEKAYTPRGEALSEAAVGSGNMKLVETLGELPDWSYYDFALAADMGHTEITAYLGRKIESADDESREESIREAGKNRRNIREYLKKAAQPLDAPERSGEIGGRRGSFTYSIESWSPWISYNSVDLSDYPVGIYVPEDYDDGKPYGLVVSMTNAKSSSRFPRHFEKTLDKHNLIWIGFDPYNGLHRIDGEANKAFCLAAVYNMLGHYNIDQSRIYIGGYSLGGQLTERILKTHSWVFDGAFFININYTGGAPDNPSWHHCKKIPIVVMEGDYDYNRSWAYKAYSNLLCRGYDNMYFAHEPMKGHILITAESFETVISLLEENGKEHGNP